MCGGVCASSCESFSKFSQANICSLFVSFYYFKLHTIFIFAAIKMFNSYLNMNFNLRFVLFSSFIAVRRCGCCCWIIVDADVVDSYLIFGLVCTESYAIYVHLWHILWVRKISRSVFYCYCTVHTLENGCAVCRRHRVVVFIVYVYLKLFCHWSINQIEIKTANTMDEKKRASERAANIHFCLFTNKPRKACILLLNFKCTNCVGFFHSSK